MSSINYEQFTNEPDEESTSRNIEISVIDVPDYTDPALASPSFASHITEQNENRASGFDKYTDCFKSTALMIYVKCCGILVIVVHLALIAFYLSFWSNNHSHS